MFGLGEGAGRAEAGALATFGSGVQGPGVGGVAAPPPPPGRRLGMVGKEFRTAGGAEPVASAERLPRPPRKPRRPPEPRFLWSLSRTSVLAPRSPYAPALSLFFLSLFGLTRFT